MEVPSMTDPVYDDGSRTEIITDEEDPPQSGEWVDSEQFLEDATDDELAMGQVLGEGIDLDDDDDNGAEIVKAIEELS
jgi:hypothetical protein